MHPRHVHTRGSQDVSTAGRQPSIALLERCVMRAERSGDMPTLRLLMGRLDLLNYKIVGAAAKVGLVLIADHTR